jgi:hypothetical protein
MAILQDGSGGVHGNGGGAIGAKEVFDHNLSPRAETAGLAWAATIFGSITIFGAYAGIAAAWFLFTRDNWISRVEIGGIALLLGFLAFLIREFWKPLAYPVLEICVGILIAGESVRVPHDDKTSFLLPILALVASVRLIVDGMARTVAFWKSKQKAKQPEDLVPS